MIPTIQCPMIYLVKQQSVFLEIMKETYETVPNDSVPNTIFYFYMLVLTSTCNLKLSNLHSGIKLQVNTV